MFRLYFKYNTFVIVLFIFGVFSHIMWSSTLHYKHDCKYYVACRSIAILIFWHFIHIPHRWDLLQQRYTDTSYVGTS